MQQLKSVFCFSGCDQSSRFGLINLAVYFCLLLVTTLFANVLVLSFLFVVVLAVIAAATAVRRVRDAGLPPIFSAAPIGVFIICGGTIALSSQGSSYFLLILAALSTLAFMVIPSKQSLSYLFGYWGPVDLSDIQAKKATSTQQANRIEPTFVDEHSQSFQPQSDEHPNTAQVNHTDEAPVSKDWIEPLKSWVLANQKLSIGAFGVLTLLSLVLATLPLWSSPEEDVVVVVETTAAPIPETIVEKVREHALEMPNNYYLMMDENKGLIIHWPSYDDDNPQFWSILTAIGESSCENLIFNDNKKFRANLVEIENEGDYYASFSPLDTDALVKAIAGKSNFNLCGFEFSLKGSSASINSSPEFSVYLE